MAQFGRVDETSDQAKAQLGRIAQDENSAEKTLIDWQSSARETKQIWRDLGAIHKQPLDLMNGRQVSTTCETLLNDSIVSDSGFQKIR